MSLHRLEREAAASVPRVREGHKTDEELMENSLGYPPTSWPRDQSGGGGVIGHMTNMERWLTSLVLW